MNDPDALGHFQDVLRDLFQFDVADLDFGVYRILNEKRDDIERFIEEDLVQGVREELRAYEEGQTEALQEEVEEAKQTVQETLSEYAIQSDGTVKEEYRDLKAAQDYRDARERLETVELTKETERRIYDDLARFFRRFYDNGDVVTKRRFSAGDSTYYVPYDGEETLLHWANRKQYYVKTTEHFRDYRCTARGVDVHFRLVDAQVPQDNVKAGDTRYFVLQGDDPVTVDPDAGTCTVQFAYRPITEEEDERLLGLYNEQQTSSNTRKTNDRRTIVAATVRQILDAIDDATIRTRLGEPDDEDDRSPLRRHLNRYTAKNTADYFVHKNLGDFLRGQLEFFIQNEVLALDEVLAATEQRRLQQVDRAKAVKKIGERIITFLAQIEDFQKRLFEKKKFVVDTGYCVTLDRVPDDLYDTILENDDQLDEWRELYAVEEWDDGLFNQGYEDGAFTRAFLEAHPHAMVDTRHFGSDVEDRLLAHLSDAADGGLADAVDGLCLQGENFQALNLLRERFKEKVDCAYIDPPFNTGNDEFLYKDTYRHSSWLSMMADRVPAEKPLLTEGAVSLKSIGEDELPRLRQLLENLYGEPNHLATFVWVTAGNIDNQSKFKQKHEYVTAFSNNAEKVPHPTVVDPNTPEDSKLFNDAIENTIVKNSPKNPISELRIPAGFPCEIENGEIDPADSEWPKFEGKIRIEDGKVAEPVVLKSGWSSKELIEEFIAEHFKPVEDGRGRETTFYLKNTGAPYIKKRRSDDQGHVISVLRNLGSTQSMSNTLQSMDLDFQYPKPTKLLSYLIEASTGDEDIVLDYFAGSGSTAHGVLNLNRENQVQRKYILVEMGGYFDTVMLPRLKKVAFSTDWDDGVPESRNGQSHVMKYHRLESYEDALNNIEVDRPEAEPSLLDRFDDYALRYMLPHETRDSETLLAPDAFEHPFDYTLQIQHGMESPTAHPVDLESTFNYLIGLEVEARRVYEHQDRRYVVVTGRVEKEQSIDTVMVIWRNQDDLDLDAEKEWAAATLPDGPFDTVYANGPSHIHGQTEPLEIEFKRRMDPAAG